MGEKKEGQIDVRMVVYLYVLITIESRERLASKIYILSPNSLPMTLTAMF